MTFQSFDAAGSPPQTMRQRVQEDSRQLHSAGYTNTVEFQPDSTLLSYTCTVNDMEYQIIWRFSMLYPAEPPQINVIEKGFDSYGQIQDNQLMVIVQQLNTWAPNTPLLKLVQEVQQRLERQEFVRVTPESMPSPQTAFGGNQQVGTADISSLPQAHPLPRPVKQILTSPQPTTTRQRPWVPLALAGGALFVLLVSLVVILGLSQTSTVRRTAIPLDIPKTAEPLAAVEQNDEPAEPDEPSEPVSSAIPATINPSNVDSIVEASVFEAHEADVKGVVFSPDGRLLASSSDDNTIKIWRMTDERLIHTLRGHTERVFSVSFFPEGQTLASCSQDDTIRTWDVTNGDMIEIIRPDAGDVYDVAISPDGHYIAAATKENVVYLWNTESDTPRLLEGHTDRVFSVAFSPDSQLLATGSGDKTANLWNVHDGVVLK